MVDWSWEHVVQTQGIQIQLFRELLTSLAMLSVANPEYAILLRGQSKDHRENGRTVVKPKAFRIPIADAESKLDRASNLLLRCIEERGLISLADSIRRSPLITHMLLQHYQVTDTPWLDLTDHPLIAWYFSNWGPSGYDPPCIYAFAIPRANVNYTSIPFPGLSCQSLSALCPAEAQRPHFQRAFALAELSPWESNSLPPLSAFTADLSRHLLCKFLLNRSMVGGETVKFGAPQPTAIYPSAGEDQMKEICDTVRQQLEARY